MAVEIDPLAAVSRRALSDRTQGRTRIVILCTSASPFSFRWSPTFAFDDRYHALTHRLINTAILTSAGLSLRELALCNPHRPTLDPTGHHNRIRPGLTYLQPANERASDAQLHGPIDYYALQQHQMLLEMQQQAQHAAWEMQQLEYQQMLIQQMHYQQHYQQQQQPQQPQQYYAGSQHVTPARRQPRQLYHGQHGPPHSFATPSPPYTAAGHPARVSPPIAQPSERKPSGPMQRLHSGGPRNACQAMRQPIGPPRDDEIASKNFSTRIRASAIGTLGSAVRGRMTSASYIDVSA
ncbi:hypothetical protein E5Q_03371 [Mixia osmundae IAM 14324]|uniref:Uncharacterized protein n=1 Tax=Mixia osmundae (strain CBS 9802 / IAM 14324 / JCM 22182 / KY 12970) TaxID=764103 RepID=G7E1J0_MIXOS|nr:hypothetical protein E5Q_03371 [Mixia osmundae IAM 14324]